MRPPTGRAEGHEEGESWRENMELSEQGERRSSDSLFTRSYSELEG